MISFDVEQDGTDKWWLLIIPKPHFSYCFNCFLKIALYQTISEKKSNTHKIKHWLLFSSPFSALIVLILGRITQRKWRKSRTWMIAELNKEIKIMILWRWLFNIFVVTFLKIKCFGKHSFISFSDLMWRSVICRALS